MNSINSSNSNPPCSVVCINKKSCQESSDTDTHNRYEQRLESIYFITKRSGLQPETQDFISRIVKSGCFRSNVHQIHCSNCHKSVVAKKCQEYIKDRIIDNFHEANCVFFQQHATNTEAIRKSNESAQSNPMVNTHTICSVLTTGNYTCQDLASMNQIRTQLMFMGQGAVLLSRRFNQCALNLVKEGSFRTRAEEFHCSQCHKSVPFEIAKQYCLANLTNKFHEPHCHLFKTNSENTASASNSNQLATSREESLATNYPHRHSPSPSIPGEASSNSHAYTATLPDQSSGIVRDHIILSNADMANSAYKSFACLDDRVKSFTQQAWPHAAYQTAESMATSGFFYSYYGDLAVCFYCGIGIILWTTFDDPEVEHVKWSSNCAYIKQLKGVPFINDTLLKYKKSIANPANAHRHTIAYLPMTQNKVLIVGVTSDSHLSSTMFGVTSSLTQQTNTHT
ncbi:MAG: hypothetical protein KAG53_05400 [Endozoicomonadaceae bacterium]|nr:hypothetical protein [Endozoicomonadaceae bacterium]